jgi:Lrp/AsnC family transcriptional regulator, leucine-responsive regulatory protein
MTIDVKDIQLLEALQEDASRKLEDLAKLVRLAPSSVHDRLRRLSAAGTIRRWTIDVDHSALGLGVIAFIGIRASEPCSELVGAILPMPEIEECHSVAGGLSLLLKVRVPRNADLMGVTERLRAIPGVESTETTIVLETQFDRPANASTGHAKASQ